MTNRIVTPVLLNYLDNDYLRTIHSLDGFIFVKMTGMGNKLVLLRPN